MKTRIVLSFTLFAMSSAQAIAAPVVQQMENKTDRIIVRYHEQPTEGNAMAFIKQGVTHGGFGVATGKRKDVLKIGATLDINDVKTLADSLESDPQVAFAEPDYKMYTMLVPNDSRYNEQWHLFEAIGGINAPKAWNITTGSSDIVVAVVDTGIRRGHLDISQKLEAGYDFIDTLSIANDGSRRDADPSDPGDAAFAGECGASIPASNVNSSWHGSHVAGTIAASTNNGTGVAGVSWGARILPLRALGTCGGYTSDIIDAIRWAAGLKVMGVPSNMNPAKIINLSLGGSGQCSQSYQDVINEVTRAGVNVVVAAGNSSQNVLFSQPANCNNVISVAATNRQGNLSSYSNFGALVDIAAPGGGVDTIYNGVLSLSNTGTDAPSVNTYKYLRGTSMAAPHVAGVLALMYSLRPNLSPARAEQLIKMHARNFPITSNCRGVNSCGQGIVDAAAVLQAVKKEPQ
ncbi:hypothetical protein ACH42_13240 [Endozoicomonas sp. (ex Bugula neritina AB1)]|nr:hypothetical protein ACH42_13240 [Endozoicomonas sp. (ex Bugula neritina AB1)]